MPALTLSLALLMLATPSELQAQVREPWRADGMANMASTASPPATIAAIALSIRSRAVQDSRCYLMSGGAVESFFISEDSPVGSVIGTLSVNGDPDEARGDITLRVQEKGAAVGIAAGSKNLTLLRALDREERLGPSNVYVNVRCDRRRSADPSFVIPVSVRVWDVNDNAPAWAGAPYRARLSELAPAGARVSPAPRASDADQPGPHAALRYRVLPGPHSEYFTFPNELESVLVVNKPLDYETLPNFTVTLRAEDSGSPPLHNDTRLYVEVLDADDQNPRFTHEHYSAVLPEDAEKGTILSTSPGPIAAADQDVGINAPLHYSATGDNKRLVQVDRDTGAVAATEHLLALTQPATIVIKAVQVDNPDRYALATLSVSRASPPPSPGPSPSPSPSPGPAAPRLSFSRGGFAAAVSEAAAPGAVLVTLRTRPRAGDESPLQFYVSDRGFLEKFAINGAGEVVLRRNLDYEERDNYLYQVMVTDGRENDTASLNITVLDVNEWEPRFRYPQYEFRVDGAGPGGAGAGPGGAGPGGASAGPAGLLPVGTLDVFDGDTADTVTITLQGPDAGLFYLAPSGALFVRAEALAERGAGAGAGAAALRVRAVAADSGVPPRQTSVPVTVHVSEHLMRTEDKFAGGVSVLGACGGALALLALLLCALLLYLQRSRRSKSSPHGGGAPYLAHEKPRPSPVAPPAPGPSPLAPPAPPALAGSGSLQSVSAGASTILANSSSSIDLRDTTTSNGTNGNGTVARQSARLSRRAAAATPPAGGPGGAGGAAAALMSDHLGGGAGRSGVAWPSATIPARVKKLSWDDAAPQDSAEEVLQASNPGVQDHMNLTVYF